MWLRLIGENSRCIFFSRFLEEKKQVSNPKIARGQGSVCSVFWWPVCKSCGHITPDRHKFSGGSQGNHNRALWSLWAVSRSVQILEPDSILSNFVWKWKFSLWAVMSSCQHQVTSCATAVNNLFGRSQQICPCSVPSPLVMAVVFLSEKAFFQNSWNKNKHFYLLERKKINLKKIGAWYIAWGEGLKLNLL